MQQPVETLQGTVESITYMSEDTGFTVFQLETPDELITVVGEVVDIAVGEEVQLTGNYTTHPTYGLQFRAQLVSRSLPATAGAILRYLASGAIKGVGPRIARRMVDTFGDSTLEVIEKNPAQLTQVSGISQKKALDIAEQYKQIFGIRTVMLYLSRYQIDPTASIRVWKQWGTLAVEVIEKNPYELCSDAIGVRFEHADAIALDMGKQPDAVSRLLAGTLHVLSHNLSNGHTCLPMDKLLPTTAAMLAVEPDLLQDAIASGVEDGLFVAQTVGGIPYLYLPELYEAETYIAGRIGIMLRIAPPQSGRFAQSIALLEEQRGIQYGRMQKKAIEMALSNNLFILTGGPGTGKTTALDAILSVLEEQGKKVALAAPTGRAAQRMSEVTGRDAKTIHRLLEVDFREDKSEAIRFKRNEKNPLRCDAVILDEVSMVDTRLLHSLLRALPMSSRLILVGDPNQLPSVGAGNILRDLIDSDVVPTVHLDEIFRQAQQSAIVSNAHQIVRGQHPNLTQRDSDFFFLPRSSYEATMETVVELCATRLPKAYGFSPLWDIQVIVPSRVGALGTVELNSLLQKSLNPTAPGKTEQKFGQVTFREGDKVMQIKNNYDILWQKEDGEEGAGIFNGDIGIIEMIDRPSQSLHIRFDERSAVYSFDMVRDLEHAFAITVHKSQGSEFEAVIMPLMSYHSKLYYRNILYTGVTRAKKIMVVLGQPDTIYRTIANDRKVLRYTNLREFACESIALIGQPPQDTPL